MCAFTSVAEAINNSGSENDNRLKPVVEAKMARKGVGCGRHQPTNPRSVEKVSSEKQEKQQATGRNQRIMLGTSLIDRFEFTAARNSTSSTFG